jgi:hypothetical protein
MDKKEVRNLKDEERERWFTVTLHTIPQRWPVIFMSLYEQHGSRSMRIAEATINYAPEKPQIEGLEELKLKLNTPLEKALYHAAMTIAKLIEYQKEKEVRKSE